jgi:hypothetical protein
MNGEMKKCGYEGESEKCPNYLAKRETHGRVNLTCLWFLQDFLGRNGGSICTLPPPKKEK